MNTLEYNTKSKKRHYHLKQIHEFTKSELRRDFRLPQQLKEIFPLLECCAPLALAKMGQIGCPERSVTYYLSTLFNTPEERQFIYTAAEAYDDSHWTLETCVQEVNISGICTSETSNEKSGPTQRSVNCKASHKLSLSILCIEAFNYYSQPTM